MEVPPNSLDKEEVNTNYDLGWRALGGDGGRKEPAITIIAGASSWRGSFTQCGGTPRMMASTVLGGGRRLYNINSPWEVVEIFTVFCRLYNINSPWEVVEIFTVFCRGVRYQHQAQQALSGGNVQQGGAQFFFPKRRTSFAKMEAVAAIHWQGGRELQVRVRPP